MTATGTPTRKNLYRGSMDAQQARAKIDRIAERIGLTRVEVRTGKSTAMRVAFTFNAARIERTCVTQPTSGANLACLALWLEDRVRNMERGIETFNEAFADSLALAVVGTVSTPEIPVDPSSPYKGTRTLEQNITLFRACLARLGIAESDVRLTWSQDATQGVWARLRMRLPSGNIMEKVSVRQPDHTANVAVLALWLQSRTKNWERGIEDMDLDRVFAGNLLPARVA